MASLTNPTEAPEDAWSITREYRGRQFAARDIFAEICVAAWEARASELGTPLSPEDKAAVVKFMADPDLTRVPDRKDVYDGMMEGLQKTDQEGLARFLGMVRMKTGVVGTEAAEDAAKTPEDSTTKETDGMSSQLKAIMLEEDDKQYVGRYAFRDPMSLVRFGTPESRAGSRNEGADPFLKIIPSHVIELKDDCTARAVYFRREQPGIPSMIVTIEGTWSSVWHNHQSAHGERVGIRISGLGTKRREIEMGWERLGPNDPERAVSKESESIENAVLEIDASILKENESVEMPATCNYGDIFLFSGCEGDKYPRGQNKVGKGDKDTVNVTLIDEETFNRRFNLEHFKIVENGEVMRC